MPNSSPLGIVHDILVRPPVKSLLRFKRVCKSCYALIESSDFINAYHKYVLETNFNLSPIFSPEHPHESDLEAAQASLIYCIAAFHRFSQFMLAGKL